jgi:hypothetical protein
MPKTVAGIERICNISRDKPGISRGAEAAGIADGGLADATVPAGLLTLARRGLVTLGAPSDRDVYVPLPRSHRGRRTAAQLLDEERGPS